METTGGRVRRLAVLAATVMLVTGACTKGGDKAADPGAESPDIGRIRLISALESFSACDQLLDYLRTEGAKLVGPYGFDGGEMRILAADSGMTTAGSAKGAAGAPEMAQDSAALAAPVAGQDYSGTNVQEEGVDEPDIVKTDGRRLVTIANGRFQVVDVSGDAAKVVGTLPFERGGNLLLSGDKVLVLSDAFDPTMFGDVEGIARRSDDVAIGRPGMPYVQGPPRSQVTVIDISDAKAPTITSQLTLDGSTVAARMVDGVARLVLRSSTPALGFTYPSGNQASIDIATESNKRLVAESKLEDWLPAYSYDEPGKAAAHAEGRITDCEGVSRPAKFSGLGMLSVVSVDAADPRPGPGATVLGAGDLVYASNANLYVTSTQWMVPAAGKASVATPVTDITTQIHKFSISDKVRTKYLASGSISGRLLNQFSMSEHKGDLRVAATKDGSENSSEVNVLREDGGVLTSVGSVGGLGKGEQIFAVRFLGDRGYVVTFRQTDPLYVLDLSDAAAPKVTGELKIPGYSAYLHPIGDHRLLGVGQDATDQGRVQGTQLSLFDVSDPANPTRLANATLTGSSSDAEYDHHAFLYWPKTGLTVVPLQAYDSVKPFVGAVGFTVGATEVKELGRVTHPDGQPVMRSLVVGDRLLSLSGSGLRTSSLDTLQERNWLAFS